MTEKDKRSDEKTLSPGGAEPSGQDDVLRVLQTKEETKAFYNKISKFYDLLSEHSENRCAELG